MTHKNKYEYLITSELVDIFSKYNITNDMKSIDIIDEILEKISLFIKYNSNNDALNAYYSIINSTSLLLKEINNKDLIYITTILNYLIKNGYLSKGNEFTFDKEKRVNNFTMLGADVIKGKALCLNISVLLNDVLKKIKYDSYNVVVNNINNKFFESYIDMVKKYDKRTLHAVTLVNNDNSIFVCDATNLSFLRANTYNELEYYSSKKFAELDLFKTIFINNLSRTEFMGLSEDIFTKKNMLDNVNIEEKILLAKDLCDKTIPLFKDFHECIKEDIYEVCKKLK